MCHHIAFTEQVCSDIMHLACMLEIHGSKPKFLIFIFTAQKRTLCMVYNQEEQADVSAENNKPISENGFGISNWISLWSTSLKSCECNTWPRNSFHFDEWKALLQYAQETVSGVTDNVID